MDQKVTGTIRGNSIQLDSPLAVADGQAVEVIVRPLDNQRRWGEGILKSAGGWAAYPEMEAVMDKIHAERKLERRSPSSP